MKIRTVLIILIFALSGSAVFIAKSNNVKDPAQCVFNTVFGVEEIDSSFFYNPPQKVLSSIDHGLDWLKKAQHPDGGWGAGFHHKQGIMDPHAVPADPATTSMVCMALLRTGSTLSDGPFRVELEKATDFLVNAVEITPPDGSNITKLTNTQIQRKLGNNIDLILTAQYFSNLLEVLDKGSDLYEKIFVWLNVCVDSIQLNQAQNGSFKGSGWAGVLQSAFANNALESAQYRGAWVNDEILDKSRDYQKGNYDLETNRVATTDGAGVVLYSVSSSTRASAKEARKAEEAISEAIEEGYLSTGAEITIDNLVKAGYAEDQALKFESSYNIYQAAKRHSVDPNVTRGFGNNGGEEFISFLQTGESMIINKDDAWKQWFDNVSGQLLTIQNADGSWNGHHCITSPVFCTATSVLILSVNNDIDQLVALGR
ncbi:MAG: prenyltransferase/squalene oxidase repeat-containing protein [Bacteroidota bacterium]